MVQLYLTRIDTVVYTKGVCVEVCVAVFWVHHVWQNSVLGTLLLLQ